jgi:hypothetical protein
MLGGFSPAGADIDEAIDNRSLLASIIGQPLQTARVSHENLLMQDWVWA